MRILAIRGENLASLGEPFVIDFEAEPLSGTGLFAITGETGSGKSTILDALCLALYGRYPRFAENQQDSSPDPGGKVKILDGSTILRRGAGKGYAEVDFVGQDNLRYRAHWEARRARNKADGAIQGALRLLHSFNDEVATPVATSKTEVQDAITARTGLTFDQFCRTVLLAQGDFDSFLLAPERERGDLLEKITGTEIYGHISIRVAEGTRALRLEVEALELQLVNLGLLNSADQEALVQAIHDLQMDIATKTSEGQILQSRIHHIDNLTRAQDNQHTAEQACCLAQINFDNAVDDRAQLAELQAVEPLRSLRDRLAVALREQTPTEQREATALEALLQAETNANTAREALESARSSHNSAEEAFKNFAPIWDEAARLDAELSVAEAETDTARSDAQVAHDAVITSDTEIAVINGQIAQTATILIATTNELATRSHQFVLADRIADIESLVQRHANLAEEATSARSRETVANVAADRLKAETNALEAQIATDKIELDRLTGVAQVLQGQVEALDESTLQADETALSELHRQARDARQLAEKHDTASSLYEANQASNLKAVAAVADASARVDAATSESLEQSTRRARIHRQAELADESIEQRNAHLRSLLVEGERCPICGATEHPYVAAGAVDALTLLAEDLRRQRTVIDQAIATLNNAAQQAATDRATAEGQAKSALRQAHEARQDVEAAFGDFRLLREVMVPSCTLYGFLPLLPIDLIIGAQGQLTELLGRCDVARMAAVQCVAGLRNLRRQSDAASRVYQAAQTSLNSANQKLTERRTALHDARLELANSTGSTKLVWTRLIEVESELKPYLMAAEVPIEHVRVSADDALVTLRAVAAEVNSLRGTSSELLTEESTLNSAQAQKTALRQQAVVRRDELSNLFEQRTATLQALGTRRSSLLGGEATSTHRTRFNHVRVAAQAGLDQAQTNHNFANASLATASEQKRSADAALLNLYSERDQARGAYIEACAATGLEIEHADGLLNVTVVAIEALRSSTNALDRALRAAQITVESRRADLDALTLLGVEPTSRTELADAFETLTAVLALSNQQLGAKQNILDRDERLRVTAADLRQQSADKAITLAIWQQVDDAIGSPGGDRFRVFAQSLTLEQLLQLANDHLDSFSKRYHLARSPASDLSLHVIDQDMGDEERAIRSLSGGERFLVSLSLALALSSLEGRDFFVDTLFIDEGFGSLDSDTLDVAITALETLHSRGRKVGIITHVAAMIENIPVQVKVQKLGGGGSTVRLAATSTYAQ
jgi:DNA repair protein SbcC/Rad50